jgi:hypothetical protein
MTKTFASLTVLPLFQFKMRIVFMMSPCVNSDSFVTVSVSGVKLLISKEPQFFDAHPAGQGNWPGWLICWMLNV